MEYYRDPKNRIQADIAYRLGSITYLYSNLSIPEDMNFSSTLDICILQNLLTNCVTLLEAMSKNERRECCLTADLLTKNLWGLNKGMIKANTFRVTRLTTAVVLRHIRNALSHPTPLDLEETYPSTGYTTIPDGSGKIHRYCFISSPDISRRNRPRMFDTEEKASVYLERCKVNGDMPEDITIIANGRGHFSLGREGNLFARVFKMLLNNREIHELVIGLSNHLAQPVQETWDGRTISKLFA